MIKKLVVTLTLVANISTAHAQQPAAKAPAISGVARADFVGLVDKEFAAIDADKDGKATAAEIEKFRQAKLEERARQINAARFNELDKDKNGSLSLLEFAALAPQQPRVNAKPLVTRFDRNKDGLVSREEYKNGSLDDFNRRDVNNDGVLSPVEARAKDMNK